MTIRTKGRPSRPTPPAVRGLLIVARGQGELYHTLQHAYGDRVEIRVLLDRRQADRRRAVQPVPGERRRRERRCLPNLEHDLRWQEYVLVRPHYRRPSD
jgi:hypothetical protein